MIVGIGLDLVSVPRLGQVMRRHGTRFLARCFAPGELARPWDPQHVAGLFAAKEAAFKALGTGWGQGVGFLQVLVAKDDWGKPLLSFHGAALERFRQLGASQAHLSLTHTAEMAAAVVILSR
ncbi:MAG: holo-ACP synthase [Thermoanaerobaculum sp.]|nr:holo-ACP synthase [Thermoanaerobaculum sp.]MDW7967357.1 holo-ACP synthase [Thermoanaerobaculum sp.]